MIKPVERVCHLAVKPQTNEVHTSVYLLLLLLATTAVMLKQLTTTGYYSIFVNDTLTYTRWARQFAQALNEGNSYPRWMPEEFWRHGSPIFILYSPLSFYLVALFKTFTGSVLEAMNLVKFASLFSAGIGIFFLVVEYYPRRIAFFAAVFYLLFPFTQLQMYVFGSFAATVSIGWYCPILLSLSRYYNKMNYRYLAYAGICYGGLLLTHLIHAYMFAFVLAALVGFVALSRKRSAELLAFPVITGIGMAVSAAYLLPLIYERKHLQLSSFVTEGPGFVYSKFFLLPNMAQQMPANIFWPLYYQLFYNQMLLVAAIVLYSCVTAIRLGNSPFRFDSKLISLNALCIFICLSTMSFMFGVSAPLWEAIPFLMYVQFPVRWMHMTAFFVVPIAAFTAYGNAILFRSRGVFFSLIVLVLCLFAITDLQNIQRVAPFTESGLQAEPVWPEEHLPSGVELSRLREEAALGEAAIVAGDGKAEVTVSKSAIREVTVGANSPVTVRMRSLNFPGWSAYLDELPSEISSAAGSKAILVSVPRGNHQLKLIFRDTPIRICGKMISLCSLLLLSACLIVDWRRKVTQAS